MKKNRWTGILLSLVLALVASGCGGNGDEYGQTQQQQDPERDEFIAQMQNELQQVDAKLDQIGENLEDSADEAREDLQEAHTKLEHERQALNEQLTELRRASQSEWKQAREKTREALEDLASRVDGMWDELTRS